MLGRVADADLPRLYACADVFAMCCRSRWGGLEQEGFGIVFLEAAACGVPSVAGDSGGAAEAVEDGKTGFVVVPARMSARAVGRRAGRLLDDPALALAQGQAARTRAEDEFAYDGLAARLADALKGLGSEQVSSPSGRAANRRTHAAWAEAIPADTAARRATAGQGPVGVPDTGG